MRKHVVSTTLDRADWTNSTIIRDHVVDEMVRLKQQPGGDLLVNGSAQLVHFLTRQQLVDEYRADGLSDRARQRQAPLWR